MIKAIKKILSIEDTSVNLKCSLETRTLCGGSVSVNPGINSSNVKRIRKGECNCLHKIVIVKKNGKEIQWGYPKDLEVVRDADYEYIKKIINGRNA